MPRKFRSMLSRIPVKPLIVAHVHKWMQQSDKPFFARLSLLALGEYMVLVLTPLLDDNSLKHMIPTRHNMVKTWVLLTWF
jgi:hypothetical protein